MFFSLYKLDRANCSNVCDKFGCKNVPIYRFDVQGLTLILCFNCLYKMNKEIDKFLKEEELK